MVEVTGGGASEAHLISFDDSAAQIGATNVQEAIDYLADEAVTSTTVQDQIDTTVYGASTYQKPWVNGAYGAELYASAYSWTAQGLCPNFQTNIGVLHWDLDDMKIKGSYTDRYYGTLKSQIESELEQGKNVIFDIDIKGGINVKKHFGERALSLFIQPPGVEELRRRLVGRGTDTAEQIEIRLAKAEYEMSFASEFDKIIVNDDLDAAKAETLKAISEFLNKN
jgi:hypothetical protein